MKLNVYQKITLLIYGCLFVYFAILHVPFKTNYRNGITYDTLFSNSSNLDVSRLVLIIVILSILTAVLILLLRNLKYSFRFRIPKPIIYVSLAIVVLIIAVLSITQYHGQKTDVKAPLSVDSSGVLADSNSTDKLPSYHDVMKSTYCTEKNALENFHSYMKFYYPDWKIYGKPVVREQSDCTFEIQFTTMDPHIKLEKEVIIVEISFDYDFSHYYFKKIRGTLY
jgi:hypothetical protein